VHGARDVQVCEHAVAMTAHDSKQWHTVAMRLSASISSLRLFTCQRNEILAGIEACCQGSVPVIAMHLRLQCTWVANNSEQRTHPQTFCSLGGLLLTTACVALFY